MRRTCLPFFRVVFALFSLLGGGLLAQNVKITKIGEWSSPKTFFRDVSVQGGYAYVAEKGFGLAIFDIRDPAHPKRAGGLRTGAETTAVFAAGRYVYAAEGGAGLRVIDIQNPLQPATAGTCDTQGEAKDVKVAGSYAYIADGKQGLQIIDVSRPSVPVLIGSFSESEPGYIYDSWRVFLSGRTAYVASGRALQIFDLSDPAAPRLVGKRIYAEARSVAVDGGLAVVGHIGGHDILDVSDPASPVFLANVPSWMLYHYWSDPVAIAGTTAYFFDATLKIVDLSNPAQPVIRGLYGGEFPGLCVANGTVYLAGARDFEIVDVTLPAAPALKGRSDDTRGNGTAVFIDGSNAYYLDDKLGLAIVDISDPAAPVERGTFDVSLQASGIFVGGRYAYLVDRTETGSEGSLYILDVTDPSAPVLVGAAVIGNAGKEIVVSGRYAYITHRGGLYGGTGSGLKIFDILDPAHPALVGSLDETKMGGSARSLAVAGDYAYVSGNTWEAGPSPIPNGGNLSIIDVSNPAAPAMVGLYAESLYGEFGKVKAQGRYAYTSVHDHSPRGSARLIILDVSQPTAPALAGWSIQLASEVFCISGKYLYGNHYIVDISDPAKPVEAGFFSGLPANSTVADVAAADSSAAVVCDNRLILFRVEEGSWPVLNVEPKYLAFYSVSGGPSPKAQTLRVMNAGYGTLSWTAAANRPWIGVTPGAGTGPGTIQVSVDPAALPAGNYQGEVTITAADALKSPQTISIGLVQYAAGTTAGPFGFLDTPVDGSTVEGSVAVTGWALDDIEVAAVKIYRNPVEGESVQPNGLVYIGDAVFVEGARPDVEQRYYWYPLKERAGWGYMLLTNVLPNGGNGTFVFTAIAADLEGHQAFLGQKTIVCDNARAVLPFGAIDTPSQGGTATGANYINYAWVLTPPPKSIPADGSTITAWVDGLPVGHPSYGYYRSDVAALFPTCVNANGAIGFIPLDTTKYSDGRHTIVWSATDSAGVDNGFGSRYFTIRNTASSSGAEAGSKEKLSAAVRRIQEGKKRDMISELDGLPKDVSSPVFVKKGFRLDGPAEAVYPTKDRPRTIEISELEPVAVTLDNTSRWGPAAGVFEGYSIVGDELRPLPIGSTFDRDRGTFTWMPGPGFIGAYAFVFVKHAGGRPESVKSLTIRISPRRQ